MQIPAIAAAERADQTAAPVAARAIAPVAASARGAADHDSVKRNVIPATPPPEVLKAIAVAARTYQRHAARGRAIHFELSAPGRVEIQLRDASGATVGFLRPSQALAIADGGGIPAD